MSETITPAVEPDPYPEHTKLRAVRSETQTAGAFLEWLGEQGYIIAYYPLGSHQLTPTGMRTDDLLAGWQDIDQNAIERENRAMLADLRARAEADRG